MESIKAAPCMQQTNWTERLFVIYDNPCQQLHNFPAMDFRHCNSWLRGLLVCLIYLGLEQGYVKAECNWEDCRDNYNSLKANTAIICISIQVAEQCLATCPDRDIFRISFENQLMIDREDNNCDLPPTTSPTTPTTQPPPPPPPAVNCSLPDMPINFVVTPMNHAKVAPDDPNPNSVLPVCTRNKLRAQRQCSLYFHSHLRQWGGEEIQACSLPGSWYLINHPDVTVEVTAESDNVLSSFTRLTKVNITFPKTSCNAFQTHSYVAVRSELLPTNTTAGLLPTMIDTQVHVNDDRTVASILAPWFNFSAIIRNQGGYLSIVTQFDADEMAAADGLCSSGCPAHAQVNESAFLQQKCLPDQAQALIACAMQTANRINDQIFTNLGNEFVFMCRMNILQLSRYDILSFIQAEQNDTIALPDVGIFVTPEPDPLPVDPVIETSSPSPSPSPSPITTSTQPITTSTTTTDSTTQSPTTQRPTTQSSSKPPTDNLHSSASSLHRHFNVLSLPLIVLVLSFLYT